jgi:hypothetical protein
LAVDKLKDLFVFVLLPALHVAAPTPLVVAFPSTQTGKDYNVSRQLSW